MTALKDDVHKRRKYHKGLSKLYCLIEECRQYNDFREVLEKICAFYLEIKTENIRNMKTCEDKKALLLSVLMEDDKKDFATLKKIAKDYDKVTTFLDDVILDNMKKEGDTDSVVMSTIHSAKGLEFNTVLILDCYDGHFPNTFSYQEGSGEDNEELRCFYVAVTRAKENLYILYPAISNDRRVVGDVFPSHFLNGCEALYEEVNLDGQRIGEKECQKVM